MSGVFDYKSLWQFTKKFELGKNAVNAVITLTFPEVLPGSDYTVHAPLAHTGITFGTGADVVRIIINQALRSNDTNVSQAALNNSYLDLGAGNNKLSVSYNGFDNSNSYGFKGEDISTTSYITAGAGNDSLSVRGVIIGLAATEVYLGDGTNNVRIFGSSKAMEESVLAMGKGADNVFLSGRVDGIIDLGDGANVLAVRGSVSGGNSHIYGGSGADKISVYAQQGGDALYSAYLYTGAGNDAVTLKGSVLFNSEIDLGVGNDTLFLRGDLGVGSSVYAMGGNNSIAIAGAVNNSWMYIGAYDGKDFGGKNTVSVGAMANSRLELGSGADSVLVRGELNNADIYAGDGKNAVSVGAMFRSKIFGGKDADTITVNGSPGDSSINTGDGNDVVRVAVTANGQGVGMGIGTFVVAAGSGNDTVSVDTRYTGTGAADIMHVRIEAGSGNDSISLMGNVTESHVLLQSGTNVVQLGSFAAGSVVGGSGNDKVYVDKLGKGGNILLGAGNDTLYLNGIDTWPSGEASLVSISGGEGTDVLAISGAAHNMTRLERLLETDPVFHARRIAIDSVEIIDMTNNNVAGGLLVTKEGLEKFTGVALPENTTAALLKTSVPGLTDKDDLKSALISQGAMRIHGDKTDTVYLEEGWVQVGTSVVDKVSYNVYAKLGGNGAWDNTDPMVLVQGSVKVAEYNPDANGWVTVTGNTTVTVTEGDFDVTDYTLGSAPGDKHIATFTQGNDNVSVSTVGAGSSFNLGHGSDTLAAGFLMGDYGKGNGVTITGQGDNSVSASGAYFTTVTFGDGNNSFTSATDIATSAITMGNGRAVVRVDHGQVTTTKIKTGTGNDDLDVNAASFSANLNTSAMYSSTVDLGEGHNLISLNNDLASVPSATNSLLAAYGTTFSTGAGNDTFTATGMVAGGSISLGAGNNLLTITAKDRTGKNAAELEALGEIGLGMLGYQPGDSYDFMADGALGIALRDANLTTGAGNDTVTLKSEKGSAAVAGKTTINLGEGDNVLTVTNENGHGIASTATVDNITDYAAPTAKGITAMVKTGSGNDAIGVIVDKNSNALHRAEITDTGGDNLIHIKGGNGLAYSNITFSGKGSDTVRIYAADGQTADTLSFTVGKGVLSPNGGTYDAATATYDVNGVGLLGGTISFTGGDNELLIDVAHAGAMGRITKDKNGVDSIAAYAEIKLDGNGDNLVDISGDNYGVYATKLTLGTGNDTVRLANSNDESESAAAMANSSLSITGGVNLVELTSDAALGHGAVNSTLSLKGENTLRVGSEHDGLLYSNVTFSGKGDARLEMDSGYDAVSNSSIKADGDFSAVIKARGYGFGQSTLTVDGVADMLITADSGFDGSIVTLNGTNNRLVLADVGTGFYCSSITSKGGDTIDITATGDGFEGSILSISGGDNLLNVDAGNLAALDSSISLGGGNDTVILKGDDGGMGDSHLSTGAGDDLIVLDGTISGGYNMVVKGKDVTLSAIDAGAGDDTIQFTVGAGALIEGAVVDGGAGLDVLSLAAVSGADTVSLGGLFTLNSTVNNVEILHIEGASRTLELAVEDLDNFKPGSFKVPGITGSLSAMRITGDDGAKLTFTDSGWVTDATLYRLDGEYYYLFINDGKSLLVSAALAVVGSYTNTGPDLLLISNGTAAADIAAASAAEVFYDFGDAAQTLSLSESSYSENALHNAGLSFGKGNDNLAILGKTSLPAMSQGYIDLGEGNNTLTFSNSFPHILNNAIVGTAEAAAIIRAGSGNDVLTISRALVDYADIDLGDGANRVEIAGSVANSALHLGAGNDTVLLSDYWKLKSSLIDLGDGANRLTITGLIDGTSEKHSVIVGGNGADSIALSSTSNMHQYADIALGEGANTVNVAGQMGSSVIQTGSGKDLISVWGMEDGSILAGDGDNTVSVNSLYYSTISAGSGADQLVVGTVVGSQVSLGAGNDTVYVEGGVYSGTTLDAGAGTRDVLDLGRYGQKVFDLGLAVNGSAKGFEVINLKDGTAEVMELNLAALGNFTDGDTSPTALGLVKALAEFKDDEGNLKTWLKAASEKVMRIEGDTGKNADSIYLSESEWKQVGTVTVDKVAYGVWSGTGGVEESAQYVLIQSGLNVIAGTQIPFNPYAEYGIDSVGATYTMEYAASQSMYRGDSGSERKYAITGSEGSDDIFISMAAKGSSFNLRNGYDTLTVSSDLENATVSSGLVGDTMVSVAGSVLGSAVGLGGGHLNTLDVGDNAPGNSVLSKGSVTGGDGSDHLRVNGSILGTKITLGEGYNQVSAGYDSALNATRGNMESVNLSAGAGDDTVRIAGYVTASTLNLGAGNNQIIAEGSNAEGYAMLKGSVSTGDGHDMIYAAGVISGTKISLGDGDNTVFAGSMYGFPIDNSGLENLSLSAGAGNDMVEVSGFIRNSTLSLGAGYNSIVVTSGIPDGSFIEKGSITGGNNGNTLQVQGNVSGAKITFGDGDNMVGVHNLENSTLGLGAGEDYVSVNGSVIGSALNLGAGNNGLHVDSSMPGASVIRKGSVTSGDGNDTLRVNGSIDGTKITLGNGTNEVYVGFDLWGTKMEGALSAATLTTGVGNDSVYVTDQILNSTLNLGAGSNLVAVETAPLSVHSIIKGSITGGAGDDTLRVVGSVSGTKITLGDGQNVVLIGYDQLGTGYVANLESVTLTAGAGDDLLDVTGTVVGGSLNLGAGDNTVRLEHMRGGSLTTGADDDYFQADTVANATISLGAGENYFSLYNSLSGSKVTMGAGDDTFNLNNEFANSTVDLGAGDNFAEIWGMRGGSLTTGAGDDYMQVRGALRSGAKVNLGAGDDSVNVYSGFTLAGGASLDGGAGSDTLRLSDVGAYDLAAMVGSGSIRGMEVISTMTSGGTTLLVSGDALGSFTADKLVGVTAIDGPAINGQSIMRIEAQHNDTVSLAPGEGWRVAGYYELEGNFYSLYQNQDGKKLLVCDNGTTITGVDVEVKTIALPKDSPIYVYNDTDDCIRVSGAMQNTGIELGDGNNALEVKGTFTNSFIEAGSGNDTVTLRGTAQGDIDLGAGHNSLALHGAFKGGANDSITALGGNDVLRAWNTVSAVKIDLGAGNNTAQFSKDVSTSTLNLGAGNDSVDFYGKLTGSEINLGAGYDSLYISGAATAVKINGTGRLDARIDGEFKDSVLTLTGMENDTVYMGKVTGSTVSLGESQNLLSTGDVSKSHITGGSFEDRITVNGKVQAGTTISLGTGTDDTLTVTGEVAGGTRAGEATLISMGSGGYLDIGGALKSNATVTNDSDTLNATIGSLAGGSMQLSGVMGNITFLGDVSGSIDMSAMSAFGYLKVGGSLTGSATTVAMSANGGNTVTLNGMGGGLLTLGAASDSLTVQAMVGGTINAGSGSDFLAITSMTGGTLNAGDGMNVINVGTLNGGTVNNGNGGSSIT
ncbi:hypothetical protein LJC26_07110, partial [Desulfovibrio sp. OttesenSCG-928-O18]|nr:hypothetical protein [Desulfovibrio sp. OttesenSCG-928-O18]